MSFFGRKLSIKGVAVGQATDKQLLLKEDYDLGNTLYYDTNGNPTVLLGNRTANTSNAIGNLQRGLFVSKAGINVTQATNSQLIFNSGQNVFKVVSKGNSIIPAFATSLSSNTSSLLTIPHGLSFTPIVEVYCKSNMAGVGASVIASSYVPLPIQGISPSFVGYYFHASDNGLHLLDVVFAIDAVNLYVLAGSATTTGTPPIMDAIPITYFYLQETAT